MSKNYFDASLSGDRKLVEGIYPTHVIEVNIKEDIAIRGKNLATIYNLKVKVADEAKTHTFTSEDGQGFSGQVYVGKEIYAQGVFFFTHPEKPEHSHLSANPGGNEKYFEFCQMLGVECLEEEIEVASGNEVVKKKVPVLRALTEDDILGKPLLSCVGSVSWEDKGTGERKSTMKVKDYQPWKAGNTLDVEVDDLPF
jgi:hypothetical protein